jgi:radical SAM protein with 4Fe4S-binding SPASM domain
MEREARIEEATKRSEERAMSREQSIYERNQADKTLETGASRQWIVDTEKRAAAEKLIEEQRKQDYENDPNNLIPTNVKYSRYQKNKDGSYKSKNKLSNRCWKMQHANVITWDGLVVPCCFDKDATHQLGNLKNQSFKEIWHNQNYQQFRGDLTKSRKNIDICANCSEGLSVWKD